MGLGSAVSASVQNEIWFDDEILMQPAPVSLNDNSPFFNGWLSGFGCYTDKHQVIYVCVCVCVCVCARVCVCVSVYLFMYCRCQW